MGVRCIRFKDLDTLYVSDKLNALIDNPMPERCKLLIKELPEFVTFNHPLLPTVQFQSPVLASFPILTADFRRCAFSLTLEGIYPLARHSITPLLHTELGVLPIIAVVSNLTKLAPVFHLKSH